jgi:glutamate---cysteine ligase / carboxylate-amine ligase
MSRPVPSETDLHAIFDAPAPLTVGVEEELMLLDPRTLDLAPRASEALAAVAGDARFKRELPAAQLEIVLPPLATAGEAAGALADARRALAAALDGDFALAAAGAHPFASPLGELHTGGRYDAIGAEFADVGRLQLCFALQVHVAVRGADRALAVHNALREHLPLLAGLAANAPVYAGRDTGLASVRPKICDLLPRQGVPPAIASWEAHAAALGRLADPAQWWWELRPHPMHGTLELRVPDAQATVADSAAVIAVAHATVAWLAERFDAGEQLGAKPTWEIEEDRWAACRHGAAGPLRPRIHALLDALEPVAERIGCPAELAHARTLVEQGGAQRQRAAFGQGGVRAVAARLVDEYLQE